MCKLPLPSGPNTLVSCYGLLKDAMVEINFEDLYKRVLFPVTTNHKLENMGEGKEWMASVMRGVTQEPTSFRAATLRLCSYTLLILSDIPSQDTKESSLSGQLS